jgi:hypothetical protein
MSTETETKKEDRFSGLSNEELVLIYYRLDNFLNTMNANLEKNVVTKQVKTPLGIATAMKEVPKEHVEKFKQSLYYTTLCNAVHKLKPVVEVIVECDDVVIKNLEQLK